MESVVPSGCADDSLPPPISQGARNGWAPSRQGAATVVCFCPPALHGAAARAGTLAPTLRRVDEHLRATCLPLLLSEGFRLGLRRHRSPPNGGRMKTAFA